MTKLKDHNGVIDKKWELLAASDHVVASHRDGSLWESIERMCAHFLNEAEEKNSAIEGDGTTTLALLAQDVLRKRYKELNHAEMVGDGSTSLIMLAQRMAEEKDKEQSCHDAAVTASTVVMTQYQVLPVKESTGVASGIDPSAIKRGIENGIIAAVQEIKNLSTPDEATRQIEQLATVLVSEENNSWTISTAQEGMSPACKATLLNSISALDCIEADGDDAIGIEIVRQTLLKPLKRNLRKLEGATVH
ncbi:MAG: hypothetical protein SVO26_07795 [Chloroflexota bacterium]|nr:hypothetical protein [Chloroflexota bacterium]